MPTKNLMVVEAEAMEPEGMEPGTLRRWSNTDREAAYFLWRTTAGRNLSLVSRTLGIPYGTLDDWKRNDDWKQRADEDDFETKAMLGNAVHTAIVVNVLPSLMTAVEIRDNRQFDPKVRLNAAIWLAGLGGQVPAQRSELEIRAKRAAVEARRYEGMDDAQFRTMLEEYLRVNGDPSAPAVDSGESKQ